MQTVTADDTGKFSFEDVTPGRYTLQASKPGFIDGSYGAPAPGATSPPVTLDGGTVVKDAIVKLTPQGVISGHVTNQLGDPMALATVNLYRTSYVHGQKQLTLVTSVNADDEGNYRIPNLLADKYYLLVQSPRPRQDPGISIRFSNLNASVGLTESFIAGYAAGTGGAALSKAGKDGFADVVTFYPEALDFSSAARLETTPGTRLDRIDIRMRRERVHSVKGRIVFNGSPVPASAVVATRFDQGVILQRGGTAAYDGSFELNDLPPGDYEVEAMVVATPQVSRGPAGKSRFTIGSRDIGGLTIEIKDSGAIVQGTFRTDDGDFQTLQSTLKAAAAGDPIYRALVPSVVAFSSGTSNSFRAKPDGSFSIAQRYIDGHRILVNDLSDAVYVKSILYNSREVTGPLSVSENGTLEIVLSTKPGSLSGVLRNDKNEPLGGVTVSAWSKGAVKSASTDQNGRFSIGGLAPGDYYVAGWESEPLNSGVIQIPELLTHFAADARKITVAESAQGTADPKLIPAAQIAAELAKLP